MTITGTTMEPGRTRAVDAGSGDLSARLQRLSEAALDINSSLNVRDVLAVVAERARQIAGSHHAVASLTDDDGSGEWPQTEITVSLSERHADLADRVLATYRSPLFGRVCVENTTVRWTDDELRREHPTIPHPDPHLPLRGWLAVPMVSREGENLGLLQLSDRDEGDFDEDDEALITQLSQLASVAVEKQRLAEQLAAQEAARFREELLSGISHDMQTPLATVVGLADLLVRDRALGTEDQHEIHVTIARQGRALRGLVQQFLDFSRLESSRPLLVRPRPTDVVEAIDRVVSLFSHQRDIVVGAAHGLPQVHADPDRLDQILSNLVSNAVKYSDDAIRIVARRAGPQVAVDVVDEGPGIPEPEQQRLFEKFHRGDAAAGTSGTGLGLYITRALVEVMGGIITLHSNPGVGSRFTLCLPLAERAR